MVTPNGSGGVTVAALRREAQRGNLAVSKIGNKHSTTLAAIERMLELCLVSPKERTSTSDAGPDGKPSGRSGTDQLKSAQAAGRGGERSEERAVKKLTKRQRAMLVSPETKAKVLSLSDDEILALHDLLHEIMECRSDFGANSGHGLCEIPIECGE